MAEVDSLEIRISASSEQAANAVNKLAESLAKLKNAIPNSNFKGFENLAKSLKQLGDTAKGMQDSIGALAKAAQAVERLTNIRNVRIPKSIGDGIRNIGLAAEMVTPEAVENLDRMTRSLQRLQNLDMKSAATSLRSVGKGVTNFKESTAKEELEETKQRKGALDWFKQRFKINIDTKALERVKNAAKAAWGHLKNLGNRIKLRIEAATIEKLKQRLAGIQKVIRSLGRVAFYRAVRSAIKAITQAFDEGLKNAYAFSAGLADAVDGRIAVALDSLAVKSLTMKNQLGAAFGSLLTALAPIISALISLITALATAITQLFAAFTGGTFLKARDTSAKFAEDMKKGGGAAKEWKNQLMGFDEINRLEDQSGGGGGGGSAANPADMFDVVPIESAIKNFVDDLKKAVLAGKWKQVGELIGNKINEAIAKIPWAKIGKKIGYWFNGAIESFYSFLKTVNFSELGERVATLINNAIGQINFETWGRALIRKLTAALDFFMGLLGNIDWGTLGTKIGEFIRGALTEGKEWLESKDWVQVGKNIKESLAKFLEGMDVESTKEALSEFLRVAFSSLGDLVGGLLPDDLGENIRDGIVNAIKKADFAAIHNVLSYKLDVATFGEGFANFWWSFGDYAGKDIVMGMAHGASEQSSGSGNPMRAAWENCKSEWASIPDKILTFAAEVDNQALDWWDGVVGWWNSLPDKTVEFEAKVADTAVQWWSSVKVFWNAKKRDVAEFAAKVKDDSEDWWTNVSTWWSSKTSTVLEFAVGAKNEASTWWSNVKGWWNSVAGELWTTLQIKLPTISVEWKDWFSAFGYNIQYPQFSIKWNKKGGIIDGATLFGAGEDGKEAIIPLERNTEWIGKVASEMNRQIEARNDGGNDEIINAIFTVGTQVVNAIAENAVSGEIDWRKVAKNVSRAQNQMARAGAY